MDLTTKNSICYMYSVTENAMKTLNVLNFLLNYQYVHYFVVQYVCQRGLLLSSIACIEHLKWMIFETFLLTFCCSCRKVKFGQIVEIFKCLAREFIQLNICSSQWKALNGFSFVNFSGLFKENVCPFSFTWCKIEWKMIYQMTTESNKFQHVKLSS